MKVVFVFSDGRTIEVPTNTQITLTFPDPQGMGIRFLDGKTYPVRSIQMVPEPEKVDESVKWCEDLWKLEDKR